MYPRLLHTTLRGPGLALLLFLSLSASSQTTTYNDTVVATADTPAAYNDGDSLRSIMSGSTETSGNTTSGEDTYTYTLRTLPDSTVRSWKKDPRFAYANDPAYWLQKEQAERKQQARKRPTSHWLEDLLTSEGFKYFIYFLLGSILLYAIIRIMADNNLRLFYRTPKKKTVAVTTDDVTAISEEELDGQLLHYIQTGDHRQATRYLYLKSLRLLDERGLIKWHLDSTNQEYQRQLSGSSYEKAFRYLTGAYEKVWYGEFALGETQFQRLHNYFEDFYKTLRP